MKGRERETERESEWGEGEGRREGGEGENKRDGSTSRTHTEHRALLTVAHMGHFELPAERYRRMHSEQTRQRVSVY